ncbi:MAG TPA: sensor histidine kinase [Ignavibacteria bacterium]|jgi:signal transduction histidine kinase
MKKGTSYIWIIGLLLIILITDAYIHITESPVPIWQTQWFLWRILALVLIIAGLIYYFYHKAIDKKEKEFEEFKRKIIESQEKDWKLIAGELHDSVGQNLSAINIFLQQNIKKIEEGYHDSEALEQASNLVLETLDEVRRISQKLYPKQIERLGLTISLQAMIERLAAATGIKFKHNIENIDLFLSKENEIQFFRVIQEVLNNIIRHAEAKNVTLNIRKSKIFILTEIEDDGIGFDIENLPVEGFGLMNIEERMRILKGTYDIKSEFGKGTQFKVTVPVR